MRLRGQLRVCDSQRIFQVPNTLCKLCDLLMKLLSGGEDKANGQS